MWSPLLRNLSGDIGNNLVNKYVITNTAKCYEIHKYHGGIGGGVVGNYRMVREN